jgi:CheY-like chemotaxis protein
MSKPPQILLVEDNPNDAELTIHALKSCALADDLVHVRDGQEALDFIFGTGAHEGRDVLRQPRVVMLDLKLPKLDGIEVLRHIRSDERTKLLPVAVFTSSREEIDVCAMYRLGANSFVVKPVDFESFSQAVSSLGHYWLRWNEPPPGEP